MELLGGTEAVKTRLGWTLQGPTQDVMKQLREQQCYFTTCQSPGVDLLRDVERLWQMDVLPWRSTKVGTRSRKDQDAIRLLETKTERVEIRGVQRHAAPLL